MDIGAFVAQLAIALSPYAAKGVEKAAEKIAEDVYGKAKGIIGALRDRLRGKPQAETALAKYEAEPDKAENQTALAQALQLAVEAQPELQRELLALAQSLVEALQAANQRGAKYQIMAQQIIGAGDYNTFNFYGAPPPPPEKK
jgi:hypothetical protein